MIQHSLGNESEAARKLADAKEKNAEAEGWWEKSDTDHLILPVHKPPRKCLKISPDTAPQTVRAAVRPVAALPYRHHDLCHGKWTAGN